MKPKSPIPLLSIAIPTRNRAEYAIHCLNSILSCEASDLEVVVQDNSDTPELEGLIRETIDDSRLHYFYLPKRISGANNCELALLNSNGFFVTLLGDDDGINPELIEAARWAYSTGVEAFTPRLSASYVWPGFKRKYSQLALSGALTLQTFSSKIVTNDPSQGALRCLRNACRDFVSATDVVKLYYGVVRRDILEEVRRRTGTYFPGLSPDLASAIALSLLVKRHVAIDYPLIIPGSSFKSMAGMNARKQHVGRLEDQEHLSKEGLKSWPNSIPKVFSVQTIWGESAWSSANAVGSLDLAEELNLPCLYAQIAVFNPQFSLLTLKTLIDRNKTSPIRLLKECFLTGIWWLKFWLERTSCLWTRFTARKTNNLNQKLGHPKNIAEAIATLQKQLQIHGKSLSGIIKDSSEREVRMKAHSI